MFNNPFTSGYEQFFGMFNQLGEQFQKMSGQFPSNMFSNPGGFMFNPGNNPLEDYFLKMGQPSHQIFSFMQSIQEFSEAFTALLNSKADKKSEEFKLQYRELMVNFSNKLCKGMADVDSLGIIRQTVAAAKNYANMMKNSNNGFNGANNMPTIGPMSEHTKKFKQTVQIIEEIGQDFENLISLFDGMDKKVSMNFLDLCLKKEPDENTKIMEYFDLWVKAFESQYKNITATALFSENYGRMTNGILKYRALMQGYIDDYVEQLGLPSKRATDTMLRHISSLRKQNRELSEKVAVLYGKIPEAQDNNKTTNPVKDTGKLPKKTTGAKSPVNKNKKA